MSLKQRIAISKHIDAGGDIHAVMDDYLSLRVLCSANKDQASETHIRENEFGPWVDEIEDDIPLEFYT